MFDIVYPLKKGEPNHDLLYSLRSLEKYGGEIGNVWLVGYHPCYIVNVKSIDIEQTKGKWLNTRGNLLAIADCDDISEDFILFNDDFILTEPVYDWKRFTNMYLGTLFEHAESYRLGGRKESYYTAGFYFNDLLLKSMGVKEPKDFEYHGPMLMNRLKLKEMFSRKELEPFISIQRPAMFSRSIYGNLYPRQRLRKICDKKFSADAPDEDALTQYGFFSTSDGVIGDMARAPVLNVWTACNLLQKSRFEAY